MTKSTLQDFLAKTKGKYPYTLVVERQEDGFLRLTTKEAYDMAERIESGYYKLKATWNSNQKEWILEEKEKDHEQPIRKDVSGRSRKVPSTSKKTVKGATNRGRKSKVPKVRGDKQARPEGL
jgi:hypothetical protein